MNGFYILIGISISAFIGIVIYEAVVSYKSSIRVYTLADSLVNVYCGMLERTFDLFYAVLFLIASQYLYDHWAPFHLPANLLTWLIGLLIFDFFAYWFHRLSHEINFLWAAHIVHHQSEELNFTTVFRVSFFAVIFRSAFFIWMPLMGFDPFTIFTLGVFLAVYQFLTHSRLIGKLGFLEVFMTTPSHHRVHHGRNAEYMDHNYGHIFIFWDRLFGTFVEEKEEPEYGITSGFESSNAYYAQFSYWRDLFIRALRARHWRDKLRVFLRGPAWTPADVGFLPYEFKTDASGRRVKRDVRISMPMALYVMTATAVTIAFFVRLFWLVNSMENRTLYSLLTHPEVLVLVAVILVSVASHGRLLEAAAIGLVVEIARLIVSVYAAHVVGEALQLPWLTSATAGLAGAMALWFWWLQRGNRKHVELAA